MTSPTALRDIWEDIVTSHEAGLSFISLWNTVLDENHDSAFPRAVWKEPEQAGVVEGRAMLDAFTLMIWFEDQHTTERTTDERDATHSDMSTVARECFYRFKALYIDDNTDGHDFRMSGNYTITPFWDRVGTSTTGVVLTFTIIDQRPPCVTGDTFPLS